MFFHPKKLKSETFNPWFKPRFIILLHTQSIVCATVGRCLKYLRNITLLVAKFAVILQYCIWFWYFYFLAVEFYKKKFAQNTFRIPMMSSNYYFCFRLKLFKLSLKMKCMYRDRLFYQTSPTENSAKEIQVYTTKNHCDLYRNYKLLLL